MNMQERKVRKEMRPRDFYSGSLKPELYPSCHSKNWSKINLKLLQTVWPRRREFPRVSRTISR